MLDLSEAPQAYKDIEDVIAPLPRPPVLTVGDEGTKAYHFEVISKVIQKMAKMPFAKSCKG